ncbi:MAG: neutral/alkaline non-lysosomal ceramidase N-terminal domain-containing protein, partial [Acidobacteriaceae bacterium]|nr:neutral/alkaline non-lysosomal ceramidase N-terminal domain-containing protein [Acidobacteriaceae bacterium]
MGLGIAVLMYHEKPVRFLFLMLAAGLPLGASGFRAAAVEADITPKTSQWLMGYAPRQSTGVHDPIYVKVAAMEANGTQVYLAASDLTLFSPGVYDEVAEELERSMGISRLNFWWGVTHTHAAPEVGAPGMYKVLLGRSNHEWNRDYAAFVKDSLIRCVKEARAKLEPARIAFGQGVAFANINRRAKDVDGTVSLGFNPDGPADRQMNLIRLERPDGSPIALLANYPIHGTVMGGQNLLISGDAPGTVAAYVEDKIKAPVLFFNGAAGNLAPIYTGRPNPREGHLSQFRVLLGDHILEAARTMGPAVDDVNLWTREKIILTPRKQGLGWPDELSRYAATEGVPMIKLPIRFLRVGDTLIWSAPVEMFCEMAMAVRNASPFLHTFYFGYTNGWFGYLPTAQAFSEGGYEPKTSPFTEEAEKD